VPADPKAPGPWADLQARGSAAANTNRQDPADPAGENNKPKGMRCRKSERPHSTVEGGEPWPTGPGGGKGGVTSQTHCRETSEGTLSPTNVYTKQQWIAKQAREHPSRAFTSLHHLIDLDWMFEAWALTRKDGAAGIDGRTAGDYEMDLEANLESLLARIKSGSYRAPPVRRHYIPKADGSKRPLGMPTIEDKVAPRAILMLLEPIYEQDFLDCSFGFRPDRSAHDALRQLCNGIMGQATARAFGSGDAGPLCLLRDHGKYETSELVPLPGRAHLEAMAGKPEPEGCLYLGSNAGPARQVPIAASQDCPSVAQSMSEPDL